MKKLLAYFGSLVIGAVIVTLIDNLIGISFANVSAGAQIAHKVIYMIWGAIVGINNFLNI